MIETKANKGPLRYRLYYRLMDLAFFINLLGIFAVVVGTAIWLEVEDITPVIYYGLPLGFVILLQWNRWRDPK